MTSAVITEGESLFILFVSHVHNIVHNIHDMTSAVITEGESLFILFVSHVHNIHDISSNY